MEALILENLKHLFKTILFVVLEVGEAPNDAKSFNILTQCNVYLHVKYLHTVLIYIIV